MPPIFPKLNPRRIPRGRIRNLNDPNFGYETMGTYVTPIWVDPTSYIGGSPFACPAHGVANSITVGLQSQLVLSEYSIKCAMYDSSRNFVAATEEKTGQNIPSADAAWYTFNFTSPPTISLQTYSLVAWAEATKYPAYQLYIRFDIYLAEELLILDEETYNSFPATVKAPSLYDIASIYCSYTPVAAKKPVMDGLVFAE